MKDKVIKPPIKKSVSIVLMLFFGLLAIALTCACLLNSNWMNTYKLYIYLFDHGEQVSAEFDEIFRQDAHGSTNTDGHIYFARYEYCDDNGNLYHARSEEHFTSYEKALAYAQENNKLDILIDGEGHSVPASSSKYSYIGHMIFVIVLILIFYIISILSLISLIRRIKYEKNPPSGWRYVE